MRKFTCLLVFGWFSFFSLGVGDVFACASTDKFCEVELESYHQDYITVRSYWLTTSDNTVFETKNSTTMPGSSSSSADPVMSIVRSDTGEVVCTNDDFTLQSRESLIALGTNCTIPTDGVYKLVIRSYNGTNGGKTELWVDSVLVDFDLPFGGKFWQTSWLGDETFQAAVLSDLGGGIADTVLLLASSNGENVRFDDDSGVRYSAAVKTGTASVSNGVVVAAKYAYNGSVILTDTLKVRVYHNDITNVSSFNFVDPSVCNTLYDLDCDGLGNQLEVALGTCPCKPGVDLHCTSSTPGVGVCANVHNARDTDGDGIPDSWEVFGRTLGDDHTELSRYGATPSHKDIFIEVDREPGQTAMSKADLDLIFRIYSEGSGSSQFLNNPNGQGGMRMHIDIQVHSGDPVSGYGTINGQSDSRYSYGNWGGSENVTTGTLSMSNERMGIWHLAIMRSSAGTNIGDYKFDFRNSKHFAHELGHVLGLKHGGDPKSALSFNYKPNYPSIMNYGYDSLNSITPNAPLQFADGSYPSLNPSNLNETVGFSGVPVLDVKGYYHYLSNVPYLFSVQGDPFVPNFGCIDWNRNGLPSCESSTKAFIFANGAASGDGASGENPFLYQHINSNPTSGTCSSNGFCLASGSEIVGGVSLTSFNGSIYLTTIEMTAASNRRILIKKRTGSTWSDILPTAPQIQGAAYESPSSQTLFVGFQEKLYVFYRNAADDKIAYFSIDANDVVSGVTILNVVSDSSPKVYKKDSGTLQIYFTRNEGGVDGKVKMFEFSGSGLLLISEQKDSQSNVLLAKSAPTIVKVGSAEYMFLVSETSEKIHKYKKTTSGLWEDQGVLADIYSRYTSFNKSSTGVDVVYDDRAGYQNGFHVWYGKSSGDLFQRAASVPYNASNFKFQLFNDVSGSGSNGYVLGRPALLRLPAGAFYGAYSFNKHIYFIPYADAIFDASVPAPNDWALMAKYMCYSLANASHGAGTAICEDSPI